MTLLHCEGFDGQTFNVTGAYANASYTGSYQTGRFGSGYSWLGNDNYGTSAMVPFSAPQNTICTGVALKNGNTPTGQESRLFDFYNGTSSILQLRSMGTNQANPGSIRIVRGDKEAAGTTIGTVLPANTIPGNAWTHLEMKVVFSTTAGSVTLRQNGVVIFDVSSVNTGSDTGVTGLALCTATITQSIYWGWAVQLDDWWVSDGANLGDLRVLNLVPVGAGSSTQFTPSSGLNWQCVDDVPPATTDYVGSTTVGAKDLYDYTVLPPGYTVIKGVRLQSLAFVSDAGVIKGRNVCQSGAGPPVTATGNDFLLSATPLMTSTVFENDPKTSAAWTNANLNAAEFGWEVRA